MKLLFIFSVCFNFLLFSIVSTARQIDNPDRINLERIKDSYIVQFKPSFKGQTNRAKSLMMQHASLKYKKTFKHAISGVSVNLNEKQVEKLRKLDFVESIEPERLEHPDVSWGLDRVNQRYLPLDNNTYQAHIGTGVNIYIVDTGINPTHNEFAGRIGDVISTTGGVSIDCHGHGSHVASLAAGASFGVASGATVNSIRITSTCSGNATTGDILEAFDWIIDNAEPNSVVNYSFSSGSGSIKFAMNKVVSDGHVLITSAGNDSANQCQNSSVDHPYKPYAAIMVASTDSSDTRSSFSNYGACVDLFAPGSSILGAFHSNNSSNTTFSGTSQASPFVAGIAASYRGRFPYADAYEVMEAIYDSATTGVVSDTNGTPNRLAFTDATPPAEYWQKTSEIRIMPVELYYLPPAGCTAGDIWATTVGVLSQGQLWYQQMWKCQ